MARSISKIASRYVGTRNVLRSVLRGAPIDSLVSRDFTYSQLIAAISSLISTGHLSEKDGILSVTTKGMHLLERNQPKKSPIWMEPMEECRIAKLSLSAQYFPGRLSLLQIEDRTRS